MLINKYKKKHSIRTRIFTAIILLIIAIFSIVAVSVNVLVNKYITTSTKVKLNSVKENAQIRGIGSLTKEHTWLDNTEKPEIHNEDNVENVEKRDFQNIVKHERERGKKDNIQQDVKMMIIDKDYNLIYPSEKESSVTDISEFQETAEELKNKNTSLDNSENIKFQVETSGREYYMCFVNLGGTKDYCNNYLVIFIDITSSLVLARKMNMLLLAALCLALIITVFVARLLSKNIAEPIQKISSFAKQIGEGNFNKFECDFQDKELHQLAEVMNKSAEYLDKYDKDQKVFFQNVSHELRTPLMSIKGYAEAIQYKMVDAEEASSIILQEGNRLEELIEELLYMSRMDNITKDYKIVERDLREIISDCTLKEKSIAIKKNIEFVYDFEDDPVIIKCDEKSIYRAFINIIDNGIRYAEKKIFISCKEDEDKIIVSIENDGPHIADNDLPYIFDRFYKGDKGKNGIGLSIVKSVILNHHGQVKAENIPTGGVRFITSFEKL